MKNEKSNIKEINDLIKSKDDPFCLLKVDSEAMKIIAEYHREYFQFIKIRCDKEFGGAIFVEFSLRKGPTKSVASNHSFDIIYLCELYETNKGLLKYHIERTLWIMAQKMLRMLTNSYAGEDPVMDGEWE